MEGMERSVPYLLRCMSSMGCRLRNKSRTHGATFTAGYANDSLGLLLACALAES